MTMNAIEALTTEHRQIERVIAALESYAATLRAGGEAPRADLARFVVFLRDYADALHHAKEEELLFSRMVESGFARGYGPVGVMLADHARGRELVRRLDGFSGGAAPWTADERQRAADAALAYATLLRVHIQKEDRILYPLAEQHLTPECLAELDASFVQHASVHAEAELRLTGVADELEARWVYGRRGESRPEPLAAVACACGGHHHECH
jgi:hemerythrin-like domain-containing protein